MTKLMWLGEDTEMMPGPRYTTWNGIKFPKDVAIEVTDAHMLHKAKGNLMFKVIEEQEKSYGESQGEETQDKEQTEIKEQKDKGTGYSPVKKKVRKKKPPAEDAERATDPG